MYYLGKIFQAAGLGIITFNFFRSFPQVMSRQVLMIGILLFAAGWIIQKYLLKS